MLFLHAFLLVYLHDILPIQAFSEFIQHLVQNEEDDIDCDCSDSLAADSRGG